MSGNVANGTSDAMAQEQSVSLPISIQGRHATVTYDNEFVWLHRASQQAATAASAQAAASSGIKAGKAARDPSTAYLCVPHALVLHSSFISDSDGGSILLRLLAPPPGTPRSPLTPWKTAKSRAARLFETRAELDTKCTTDSAERLAAYLQGPCSNLRLVKIEARISDVSMSDDAAAWASRLMESAYDGIKPYRRLRVLVNPIGGPGKATQIYNGRVLPILEAAGCTLDTTITTHSEHGVELARELDLGKQYDAVVCVSGDGMLHEVLNGFAQRKDAREALAIPLVPVPAGSGNAVALNLLGVEQGFNLALACLNVIKGRNMDVDVCCVTQPYDAAKDRKRPAPGRSHSKSGTRTWKSNASGAEPEGAEAPSANGTQASSSATTSDSIVVNAESSQPYSVSYSFLSQAIGLMADVDLGTEDMRALGDTRFVIGYISGVLQNRACEVDIYVKLGEGGTLDKSVMLQRNREVAEAVRGNHAIEARKDDEDGQHSKSTLRNGSVTDLLPTSQDGAEASLPSLVPRDPSWSHTLLSKSNADATISGSQWYKLEAPISALYAGKIPYVSRDLLQFPFAQPADGCVDIALQLHDGGRAAKLRAISGAETGVVVYDPAVVYLKCEAYRVVPHLEAGNKRLKKGGLVSIDGEPKPYRAFQVEVDGHIKMRVLSLFGKWQVPDIKPPKISSSP